VSCCVALCGDPVDAAALCTKLRTEIVDTDSNGAKCKGAHVVLAQQVRMVRVAKQPSLSV
jgi:hypothetical protein